METKRVLPNVLRNRYDADDRRYIGSFSELHFSGSSIEAHTLFSVYYMGEVKPIARSRGKYPRTIVGFNGKAENSRTIGYRSKIIGDMANSGLIIPDDVLDGILKPMEDRLVIVHKRVFPERHVDEEAEKAKRAQQEAKRRAEFEQELAQAKKIIEQKVATAFSGGNKEIKTVFIEGKIKTTGQTTVGHFNEPVTVYTLSVEGQIRRIGVRGHCDLLLPGDFIRGEVIDGEVVCRTTHQEYLQVLPGEFQVVENQFEYLKMVGWKKLDSATSQEGEKNEEEEN